MVDVESTYSDTMLKEVKGIQKEHANLNVKPIIGNVSRRWGP